MEDSNNWMDVTNDVSYSLSDAQLGIQDPFELSIESPMDHFPDNNEQTSLFASAAPFSQGLPQSSSPQTQFQSQQQQFFFQQQQQQQQFLFQQQQQQLQLQQQQQQQQQLQQQQQQLFQQPQLLLAVKKEFEEIQSLDEDALVALDSDTFQDYVDRLRQRRPLTRNEEMLFKKLFKKIKNRESARKSRQAKKEISQELDDQVHVLSQKTQSLKLEVSALAAVNQQIRNEISFSEKLIASNPFLSMLYNKTWGELNKSSDSIVKLQVNENTQTRCTFHSSTDFVSNNGVTVHS
jgi:hypothetical protein